jgi:flavodoxin
MYFDQGMNSVSSGNDEADAVTSASLAGYSSDDLTENNIRVMKNEIISKTGGVPYSIRVNEPYADDYEDMVNQAQDDQDDDKQFSFQTPLPNLSGYDVVFVGMPVWWGGLPQPVVNVFEQLDFSGKTIIPFGIHLGSGFGQMISQIKEFEPNAEVSDDGLTINSRTANEEVRSETDEWIDGLTY